MIYYIIFVLVVSLDQITKFLIQTRMHPFQSIDFFNGIVSLTYAQNTGAAFSILRSQNLLFILITIGTFIIIWIMRRQIYDFPPVFKFGLALALSGALGNFIDRVRLGFVVDFVDLHFWPVFNVADMGIVCGAGLLILGIIMKDASKSKTLSK